MNADLLPLGYAKFLLIETTIEGEERRQPFLSEDLAESTACFLRQHGSASSFRVVPAHPVLPGLEGRI